MKSWKTTLAGLLFGGGYAFLSAMSTGLKPKDAALSVGIAIIGGLAKDYDKSNASHQVPTEKVNTP